MHLANRVLLVVGILSILASRAGAIGVPSPLNSSVDPCVVTSPDGTLLFTVVVRDLANNPCESSVVVMDFSRCPMVAFCPNPCTGCVTDPDARSVRKTTDAAGVVTFDLRMGGECAVDSVWVFADGVMLGRRGCASLDMNGDLAVTDADVAEYSARWDSPDQSLDPGIDFYCGGGGGSHASMALLLAHLGSDCDTVVPVRPQSWGALKFRYR